MFQRRRWKTGNIPHEEFLHSIFNCIIHRVLLGGLSIGSQRRHDLLHSIFNLHCQLIDFLNPPPLLFLSPSLFGGVSILGYMAPLPTHLLAIDNDRRNGTYLKNKRSTYWGKIPHIARSPRYLQIRPLYILASQSLKTVQFSVDAASFPYLLTEEFSGPPGSDARLASSSEIGSLRPLTGRRQYWGCEESKASTQQSLMNDPRPAQ